MVSVLAQPHLDLDTTVILAQITLMLVQAMFIAKQGLQPQLVSFLTLTQTGTYTDVR
jgi:hypothetical protein